jgi:crotonobetainyl-CoA:carnitine CoA-transferase CaiB-like acyl-CoA transferase
MDAEDWLEILRLEDMACARVNSVAQVVEHPQVIDQKMIVWLAHQLGGQVGLVDSPIRIGDQRLSDDYSPPPLLGEHTTEILTGLLGYSEQKICELRRQQEEHAEETERHTVKKR